MWARIRSTVGHLNTYIPSRLLLVLEFKHYFFICNAKLIWAYFIGCDFLRNLKSRKKIQTFAPIEMKSILSIGTLQSIMKIFILYLVKLNFELLLANDIVAKNLYPTKVRMPHAKCRAIWYKGRIAQVQLASTPMTAPLEDGGYTKWSHVYSYLNMRRAN